LAVALAAGLLQPSDATLVARALSSREQFAPPAVAHLVERREMSSIVDAIERGGDFVIVDGGNRVGKSVAVEVAAARLSASRTVRWSVCDEGSTAAAVLQQLLGLDSQTTVLARVLASVAALPPLSVADMTDLVLSARMPGPEPVFVVESAERLEIMELRSLLCFAKELVDERRGRFVVVFAPTDKLDVIGDFGSVSRAKVIHVGNLDHAESMALLASAGCDAGRAAALDAVVGGHLPHLISDDVDDYCRGVRPLAGVQGTLLALLGAEARAVDRVLGSGSACRGLCGVEAEAWPTPELLDALLKKHLVVAALKRGVLVESRLVRAYVNASCSCGQGK